MGWELGTPHSGKENKVRWGTQGEGCANKKQIHAFPSVTLDLVLFVQRHVKEPKR
jgi:hypothetical protein